MYLRVCIYNRHFLLCLRMQFLNYMIINSVDFSICSYSRNHFLVIIGFNEVFIQFCCSCVFRFWFVKFISGSFAIFSTSVFIIQYWPVIFCFINSIGVLFLKLALTLLSIFDDQIRQCWNCCRFHSYVGCSSTFVYSICSPLEFWYQ